VELTRSVAYLHNVYAGQTHLTKTRINIAFSFRRWREQSCKSDMGIAFSLNIVSVVFY